MNPPPDADDGLRSRVRRAADTAFDATVGRVGQTVGEVALEATQATAEQVIEELEPYLIDEAIPRIVAGITPYLTAEVVPDVLAGIQDHLTSVTIPQVLDGVQGHLVEVTVPDVVAGVTPRLVDDLLPRLLNDLQPYLEQDLVPQIVDALMPQLEQKIAPQLVDALMPTIRDQVAPDLVDALMPKLETDVAPQLIDALMPRLEQTIAPQLIDALMPKLETEVAPQLIEALMPKIETDVAPRIIDAVMPKIRNEVVPLILDDIVDDPRIRDLIREQSQGLFLDAIEGFRGTLADVDSLVERVGRRLVRKPPRPEPETALQMVLADTSTDDTQPVRLAIEDLSERRATWRTLPIPPAPPGREFTYAGVATRLLGLGIDLTVVGYLGTLLFSNLTALVESLFDGSPPSWLTATLVAMAASVIPVYLGSCYWVIGRSLGMGIVGTRLCTPDGRRPAFFRAYARAWLGVFGLFLWLATGVVSLFDRKRRSLLDLLAHTEVRYSVPQTQQRRHVRDAVLEQRRRDEATSN